MNNTNGIPNILFKYRDYSNKNNKRTLFNFELFMASTSMFNDPYEGSIPFVYEPSELTPENVFCKLYELAKRNHPDWQEPQIHEYCYKAQQMDLLHNDDHIEKENERNRQAIDNNFGILSLTIHPTNYLMWSHYANCHTGFCLGFETKILYETTGGAIGPVDYKSRLPKLKLFEEIEDFHRKQLATKSIIWQYEDEYRVVKSNASRQVISYPKEMIKMIFLGCRMSYNEDNEIVSFVKSNDIDCEIYKLSLDKESFILKESRIY